MLTIKTRAAGISLVATAMFMLLGGTSVHGQVTLTYKFKKGDAINYTSSSDMKQSMSVMGMDIKTTMTQGVEMGWTVNAVQNGKAELTQKITRLRQKMDLPGGQGLDFDSKDGKKPEGQIGAIVGPIFEAMVGSETAFKMDLQGETSDMKISEKLLKAIEGNPALAQMGGMFTEEGMKNMMQQSAIAFPKEPISKGKTWNKTLEMKMPFGVMKLDTTYTYQGSETRNNALLEKIDTTSTMAFVPAADAKIALKIKSSEIKGAIYFDNKAGRIVESSQTQKAVMEVTAGGQMIDTNQDQTTTLKLVP